MDGAGCWSTASACRRIASLLVPEVPGRLGPPAGASAGFDGAGAGLPNAGGLDGAATHQPGRACLRTALRRSRSRLLADAASCCAQKVLAEPPVPAGGASGAPVRPDGAGDGFGDARIWAGRALAARGPRPVCLLEASPVVVGASWFFCVGDGEGPVAGSFPMVMRSSPEGALVSDRRPGPGSGSRSTRLTAGGGVPGADRQGDRAMARRGRQGGLNAAPCFRRPRRGARRCAAAGRPVPG